MTEEEWWSTYVPILDENNNEADLGEPEPCVQNARGEWVTRQYKQSYPVVEYRATVVQQLVLALRYIPFILLLVTIIILILYGVSILQGGPK